MEHFASALTSFKSIWPSLISIVGIIIWVYRLRHDTNENTNKIENLSTKLKEDKDTMSKKIETHSEQVNNLTISFNEQFNSIRMNMDNKIEKMWDDLKDELVRNENRGIENNNTLLNKLEEIQKDVNQVKIDVASKLPKN